MPRPSAARPKRKNTARNTTRRVRPSRPRSGTRARPRRRRAHIPSGTWIKLIFGVTLLAMLALGVNWVYQALRKPSELLFPVSGALYKTPPETWREYSPLFDQYATPVMTPELLAAIAQVESSGNPIVRTYWRWSWTTQPFEIYRPASSAVGMYQMTDGTFAQARRLCIRDHTVAESCWWNRLYARVVPGDAVELTSAYLDRAVTVSLARNRIRAAPLRQQQKLAEVIHLCGAAAGDDFAARGFRLNRGQRCGDHAVQMYLTQIATQQAIFDRLAKGQQELL